MKTFSFDNFALFNNCNFLSSENVTGQYYDEDFF